MKFFFALAITILLLNFDKFPNKKLEVLKTKGNSFDDDIERNEIINLFNVNVFVLKATEGGDGQVPSVPVKIKFEKDKILVTGRNDVTNKIALTEYIFYFLYFISDFNF